LTLYADSSALIKLFLEEDGSAEVRRLLSTGELTGTSIVSYVEMRAALAAAARGRRITGAQLDDLVVELNGVWRRLFRVEVDEAVVGKGGDLAQRFGLRGYDALQLASLSVFAETADATLMCWDADLRNAGRLLGYEVIPD